MRKFLLGLVITIGLLSLNSCDVYSQAYSGYGGITYEYSYNNYPVRYIGTVPYYYHYNAFLGIWTWNVLEYNYHPYIVHHRPTIYRYPHHRPSPQPYHHQSNYRGSTHGNTVRPSNNHNVRPGHHPNGMRISPGKSTHRGGGRR